MIGVAQYIVIVGIMIGCLYRKIILSITLNGQLLLVQILLATFYIYVRQEMLVINIIILMYLIFIGLHDRHFI